jgi:DNA (cytosine-5)-methyltransferase 1
MQYRLLEFFAGVGLARLGLGENWEVVMANDVSQDKAQAYALNFGAKHFVLEDINNIDVSSIPSADMAWASFPCQDISLAGYRDGITAKRSGTFWAFWRLMKEKKQAGDMPPIIAIENVEGLLSDKDFNGICHALAALGMQFGFLLMDAVHFVPQSRKRVFIVAIDSRMDVSRFTYKELPADDMWITSGIKKAYEGLDPQLKNLWCWWKVEPYQGGKPSLEEIIEAEPDDITFHSKEKVDNLISMMSENHVMALEQVKKSGEIRIGTIYRRMRNKVQRAEVRFDGVAGCLRTPKGGSSVQTVVIVEGENVKTRLISKREAARLMGVPDTFILPSSRTQALYAMGDAVAVPVVSWLSKKLLIPLVGEYISQEKVIKQKMDNIIENIAYHEELAEYGLKKWEEGDEKNGVGECQTEGNSAN